MSPINGLIFGLGLFFLGLRLVGENLRRLSGSGFHSMVKRGSHAGLVGGLMGLLAGALMQSATAVTFILVSMTGSGLIKPRAAGPIIIWSNVGLTALAFVATFNIHPLVALVVGGAGIVLGTIRIPFWQTLAGVLLGLGLILVGLEQMSAGAAPLKDAVWFRSAMDAALSWPPWTFLAGILAAAILQSNTGAAMLVITFAMGGLLKLEQAMLMIYGTNLGAIGLRCFLSAGLRGPQLRLVRLEDLFCVVSGVLMVGLYTLEWAGVPLLAAGLERSSLSISSQLAVVFFLSNLIPAVFMSMVSGPAWSFLKWLWPTRHQADDPARPQFLSKHALDDPHSALDLMGRELARLLGTVQVSEKGDGDSPPGAFVKLGVEIEKFAAKLAARNTLDTGLAEVLHRRRAELSIIRHIEEAVRYFSEAYRRENGPVALRDTLGEILAQASRTAENDSEEGVRELQEATRLKGEKLAALQKSVAEGSLAGTALYEDFSMVVWSVHRLAKLLDQMERPSRRDSTMVTSA